MTTHTVDIEGLPEGWEVNTIKIDAKQFPGPPFNTVSATVHLRKTKPREITLVEVEQGKHTVAFVDDANMWTYWRIKEE